MAIILLLDVCSISASRFQCWEGIQQNKTHRKRREKRLERFQHHGELRCKIYKYERLHHGSVRADQSSFPTPLAVTEALLPLWHWEDSPMKQLIRYNQTRGSHLVWEFLEFLLVFVKDVYVSFPEMVCQGCKEELGPGMCARDPGEGCAWLFLTLSYAWRNLAEVSCWIKHSPVVFLTPFTVKYKATKAEILSYWMINHSQTIGSVVKHCHTHWHRPVCTIHCCTSHKSSRL